MQSAFLVFRKFLVWCGTMIPQLFELYWHIKRERRKLLQKHSSVATVSTTKPLFPSTIPTSKPQWRYIMYVQNTYLIVSYTWWNEESRVNVKKQEEEKKRVTAGVCVFFSDANQGLFKRIPRKNVYPTLYPVSKHHTQILFKNTRVLCLYLVFSLPVKWIEKKVFAVIKWFIFRSSGSKE